MTRRLSIADLLTVDEAAHLAMAVREYRRRHLFAVPHSFAELQSELTRRAMMPTGPTGTDLSRQEPPTSAGTTGPLDDESMAITDVLTVAQTAHRLQLSTRSVERRIAAGELSVVRSGRSVRVRIEDLDAFLARGGAA